MFEYEHEQAELLEHMEDLLERKQYAALRDLLLPMEAADIALLMEDLGESRTPLVFRLLPKELAAEVFVSRVQRIAALLHLDKAGQCVQGQHRFRHRDEEQIGDLFPVIELLHRAADQALLHIIADHGRGQGIFAQRFQIFTNIFGGLLQVQTYIGNFVIAGQAEFCDGSADLLLGFLFHKLITTLHYRQKLVKSQ